MFSGAKVWYFLLFSKQFQNFFLFFLISYIFAPGNHAVFSRVEEWRLLFSLTLVLNVMFYGLLADVPDGGNEVTFRPEYLVTAPVDAPQCVGVPLPDAVTAILLQAADNLQRR